MAATALAELGSYARLVNERTLRMRPSVRPLLMPSSSAAMDAGAVGADGALQSDERRQAGASRPGHEPVQTPGGLAGAQVGVEDRTQPLPELVGAPHLPAGAADRGELLGLGVGEVFGAFEQRPAGVLEPAGVGGAGAVA